METMVEGVDAGDDGSSARPDAALVVRTALAVHGAIEETEVMVVFSHE